MEGWQPTEQAWFDFAGAALAEKKEQCPRESDLTSGAFWQPEFFFCQPKLLCRGLRAPEISGDRREVPATITRHRQIMSIFGMAGKHLKTGFNRRLAWPFRILHDSLFTDRQLCSGNQARDDASGAPSADAAKPTHCPVLARSRYGRRTRRAEIRIFVILRVRAGPSILFIVLCAKMRFACAQTYVRSRRLPIALSLSTTLFQL